MKMDPDVNFPATGEQRRLPLQQRLGLAAFALCISSNTRARSPGIVQN